MSTRAWCHVNETVVMACARGHCVRPRRIDTFIVTAEILDQHPHRFRLHQLCPCSPRPLAHLPLRRHQLKRGTKIQSIKSKVSIRSKVLDKSARGTGPCGTGTRHGATARHATPHIKKIRPHRTTGGSSGSLRPHRLCDTHHPGRHRQARRAQKPRPCYGSPQRPLQKL